MRPTPIISTNVHRLKNGEMIPEEASVVVEEPLAILVDGVNYAVAMRTPGDDLTLAAGFCLAEGLIDGCDDIGSIQACDSEEKNEVSLTRVGDRPAPQRGVRHVVASSCGLCGRELIEDVVKRIPPIESTTRVSASEILSLGERLRESQKLFVPTGGAHAVALFDANLTLLSVAEDVGRHNAFDKAVGGLLLDGNLSDAEIAVLSGRCGFEMVQKAARAGIAMVASVSAPTGLAIDFAQTVGIALIGFVRKETLTVYHDAGRVAV